MSETRFIPARAEGRDIVPETLTEGLNADELAAGGDELAFEFLLKVGLGHRFSHAFNGFRVHSGTVFESSEDIRPVIVL
jgi:hypothetical protein